jgi:hypothetical protein
MYILYCTVYTYTCICICSLGNVILQLCTIQSPIHHTAVLQHINKSLDIVSQRRYTNELKNMIILLLTKTRDIRTSPTIFDIQSIVASHISTVMSHTLSYSMALQSELAKEYQNGRIFRLLSKLLFVTDRPEQENWSTTGDRYLLQLYIDYVFHQLNIAGLPNVDYGHVINTLNKLDAGLNEKTLLTSRQGDAMLIVKYSDLKKCIENSFMELIGATANGTATANDGVESHSIQHDLLVENDPMTYNNPANTMYRASSSHVSPAAYPMNSHHQAPAQQQQQQQQQQQDDLPARVQPVEQWSKPGR